MKFIGYPVSPVDPDDLMDNVTLILDGVLWHSKSFTSFLLLLSPALYFTPVPPVLSVTLDRKNLNTHILNPDLIVNKCTVLIFLENTQILISTSKHFMKNRNLLSE